MLCHHRTSIIQYQSTSLVPLKHVQRNHKKKLWWVLRYILHTSFKTGCLVAFFRLRDSDSSHTWGAKQFLMFKSHIQLECLPGQRIEKVKPRTSAPSPFGWLVGVISYVLEFLALLALPEQWWKLSFIVTQNNLLMSYLALWKSARTILVGGLNPSEKY